jgi:hypothetical protein
VPLQPQPSRSEAPTAITSAIEDALWAHLELLTARTPEEIRYCRRVIKRRVEFYRWLMEHPGVADLRPATGGA